MIIQVIRHTTANHIYYCLEDTEDYIYEDTEECTFDGDREVARFVKEYIESIATTDARNPGMLGSNEYYDYVKAKFPNEINIWEYFPLDNAVEGSVPTHYIHYYEEI